MTDNSILLCLFAIFFFVSYSRYDNGRDVQNILCCSDPQGYYMYLPALFVYKDIHSVPDINYVGEMKNEKGECYTKYSCGTAYFYLPFFLGAHLYVHLAHTVTTPFGAPYCYGIMLCGVFWAVIGLFLLKTLLLKYFSRRVTWLTLFCIIAGTNFFNYATLEVGMSHVYNFTLFAAALLMTDLYYKDPGKGKAMILGLITGWIVLSRPTNIVMLIFLFLYRVVSINDFRARIRLFKENWAHLPVAAVCFIAMWVPQLLYWKAMTGHWIKYSYGDEGFTNWKSPKMLLVLFDTENGLLVYSPILFFLFWALLKRRKDIRSNFWGTSIVFITITYVFGSWWAWCFGGAFGHRCYVDYYPLLALPLAVTMECILKLKNSYARVSLLAVILVFCYYSVALSQIYMYLGQGFNGPDWKWNWDTWLTQVRRAFFIPNPYHLPSGPSQ